jgi:hypothetical protein
MSTDAVDLRKIMISGSVFISIVSGAFFAGAQWKGMQDREKDIVELRQLIKDLRGECKDYTDLEVGGLRADWERELNRKQ